MKLITLQFDHSSSEPLYIQLYNYLKNEVTTGAIAAGEKLPSLRKLSKDLGISITTTELAYSQLLVEGYVTSRPQSGYYVAQVAGAAPLMEFPEKNKMEFEKYTFEESPYRYDLSCFDFGKWKKCASRILNDYSHMLLFESDPQGEAALRFEISKYVYKSRGVIASPDQIVIGAGTQQLTGHLCRIMRKMNIGHVATEDPGYVPVQNIFRDHGFSITKVPVEADGIKIEKLPANIPTAVYVSPSNQFPTGSIMPVGKRYRLLEWAKENNSFILEDDYDSELRYFGKPVPALQGLDRDSRVVYLGSFSSTLFPAVKISYMVLPKEMTPIFHAIKSDYTQTCSKTEQLTLALFMEEGFYYTNIRKLRNLYAQKLQVALAAFEKYGDGIAHPANKTNSGINIILKVRTKKAPEVLCEEARQIGLNVLPLASLTDQDTAGLIFYYNQIPLDQIDSSIKELLALWAA
ncbi:MAG: PLP-dependent aminotransferase family protein [Firmicutes bacterium]|nr:PLP-dependent aminotransferase family protein [Bacillota bacterium]